MSLFSAICMFVVYEIQLDKNANKSASFHFLYPNVPDFELWDCSVYGR